MRMLKIKHKDKASNLTEEYVVNPALITLISVTNRGSRLVTIQPMNVTVTENEWTARDVIEI